MLRPERNALIEFAKLRTSSFTYKYSSRVLVVEDAFGTNKASLPMP